MRTLSQQIKKGKGNPVNIEGRYKSLSSDRDAYVQRAIDYSKFTLPYIMPEVDTQPRTGAANQHGYQSIGAQAVNHLSNKLTINMFPTGRSFFNLKFDAKTKVTLEKAGYNPIQLSELLVEAEKRCTDLQTKIAARVAYTEAFKNLIVTGNVLMYLPADGFLQAIKLNRYVVTRDLSGKLIELIILEQKAFGALTDETRDAIKAVKGNLAPKDEDNTDIYTWVHLKGKDENGIEQFEVAQSVQGIMIKDIQYISAAELPWIPLRWNSCYGEDYGRGLVEDNAGDFFVVEFLSEAIAKGMALMSDVKYLIRPGSQTDIDEISGAPVGEWLFGNLDDIGVLQLEKYADFTPIAEVLTEYKKRIGQAFLLNSAVRRNAERITTLELRMDAQELEVSLGGIYSLLAQTFQTPLAMLYLKRVGFPLPDDTVVPNIVTGLEAFGRIDDLDKLRQFTEMMQLTNTWPMPVQERIKWDIFAREIAASLSMKLSFMMSAEEWKARQEALAKQQQAQQEQEQVAEVAKSAAPALINNGGINGRE